MKKKKANAKAGKPQQQDSEVTLTEETNIESVSEKTSPGEASNGAECKQQLNQTEEWH